MSMWLGCGDWSPPCCECAANLGQIRAMNSPFATPWTAPPWLTPFPPPPGRGIAVIRVSGDHALELGSKVFSKPLADVTDRSVAFGKFIPTPPATPWMKGSPWSCAARSPTPDQTPSSSTSTALPSSNTKSCAPSSRRAAGKLDREIHPARLLERTPRPHPSGSRGRLDCRRARRRPTVGLALDQLLLIGFAKEINALREALIGFAGLLELELDFAEEDVEFADRALLRRAAGRPSRSDVWPTASRRATP